MNWFRGHPIRLGLIIAVLLVLVGIFVIQSRGAVAPTGQSDSWGNIGAHLTDSGVQPPSNGQLDIPLPNEGSGTDVKIPIITGTSSIQTITKDAADDFSALLALIARERTQSTQAKNALPDLVDAFSFLPTIPADTSAKKRTSEQELLYHYGNKLGAQIQAFEGGDTDTAQIMNKQATDRSNPALKSAMRASGQRYIDMGIRLRAMENVPESMKSAHEALANGYTAIGKSLQSIPESLEDQAFIAAITAHNKSADGYTSAYVGMATLFSVSGVTFSSEDAGSVFSFGRN